jgi:hypothetical protein
MVKVSVIVPIYNSEKYLKRCIDSLVNQTLSDIELILINDGSTDSSDSIIRSYNDSRIKYFKRSNHGIGATRNFGIDKAVGEFIGFVDSDDYVESDFYEKMYNECINKNLDIVICDHYIEKKNTCDELHFINFDVCNLNESPNLLMDINLAPWNKIYRKSLLDDTTYYPIGVKYEDTPWVAKMFLRANRIGKLNECLYHYIVHSNSETTVIDSRVYDIFKITDVLLNDLGNNERIKSSVEDLVIYLITKYTISQRYVKNKKDRDKFIDYAFCYLKKNINNFRKSNYFKKRNKLKGCIEKSCFLSKLYCDIYVIVRK